MIFEEKLVNSLRALNIRDFYSPKNVKTVIDAADGYQPHLVAPEMGIRRLIELGLDRLHEPTMQCVRAVDRVLQTMVERAVDRQAAAEVTRDSKGGPGGGGTFDIGGAGDDAGEILRRFPALRAAVTSAALAGPAHYFHDC